MHVAEAKQKLGSRVRWICDTMSNDLKHALGDAPNSEFIVAPDGKIVVARRWSSPAQLREDLAELVGPIKNPTTIEEVGMKPLEPRTTARTGVVARIQLPGRMTPIKVSPVMGFDNNPFYVKLRAEVEQPVLQGESGKLYLGFFLDPLYKVHWNNQAAPVEFELSVPEGMTASPASGKGPIVKEKADADPREFLVELSGDVDSPIRATVRYFACDDAETFCKPVAQEYEITIERDRDGGSRRRAGGRRGGPFASRGGSGRPRAGRSGELPPMLRDAGSERRSEILKQAVAMFREYDSDQDGKLDGDEWSQINDAPSDADSDRDEMVSLAELVEALKDRNEPNDRPTTRRGPTLTMFKQLDRDGDGKLSKSELPERMQKRWDFMDGNGDGVVDEEEQAAIVQRFRRSGSRGPDRRP